MAKKKEQADAAPEETASGDVLEQSTAAVIEVPVSVPAAKWLVSLASSTPIRFQSLEVDAATPDEAREKFNAANGISGSDHPYTIVQV